MSDKSTIGNDNLVQRQTCSVTPTDVHTMDLDDQASINNEGRSFESMLVDQALDTVLQLPCVSDEMEAKARDTEREIERLQCCLSKNEDLLCQETEYLSKCKDELASVLRQTWLTKEQSLENHQKCQTLQKEIDSLLTESVSLERRVSRKSLELERTTKAHLLYLSKMKGHEERVKQCERNLPVFKQLKDEQEKLSSLRKDWHECSGREAVSTADAKVQEMELECLDTDLNNIIMLIEEEKEKQEKLKQQMDVLTKRNTARKIRLKNQLKETVGRNRQWNEEMRHLEHAILELQKELEE